MKRYAIVHVDSGAIVALTSSAPSDPAYGLVVVPADPGVGSETHWWNGAAFPEREAADISADCSYVLADDVIDTSRPEGSWVSLSDGSITNSVSVLAIGGLTKNVITLIGQFIGSVSVDIVPASASDAMDAVRAERDRLLLESDKYVLLDFPIDEAARSAWIAYRKALREIPEDQPDSTLATIAWPVKPA